jgi:hypothetical protein
MQAILALEIISTVHEASYQHPPMDWKPDLNPDTVFFDLDNLSDGLVMKYASDLLDQSEKAVVLLNVISAEASVGKILPLLEKCLTHPRLLVVSTGYPHALISRYVNLLPPERRLLATDLSAARPFVVSFLKS